MSVENGAKTRFAAIFSGVFLALIMTVFGYFVKQLPLASLAALLLASLRGVVNKKQLLLCLKATSSDAFVFWMTFLSCMFFSLDTAFYIGVFLSIFFYLKNAAVPQLVESNVYDFGNINRDELAGFCANQEIRVIKVRGELFFGAADLFHTTLKAIAEDDTNTRVIILQMKNARDMDATTCLALKRLSDYLQASGRYLICCGLTPQIWEVMSNSEMVSYLGKENLFLLDERNPHRYKQKALERAKELVLQHQESVEGAPELVEEKSELITVAT